MRPRKSDPSEWDLSEAFWKAALQTDMKPIPAEAACAMENTRAANLWGCRYDLVTDGLVEMVEYAGPQDVKVNDLVIITKGENPGHVAIVEETFLPFDATSAPIARLLRGATPDGYARLKRVWPAEWRGPSGSYWAPEFRLDAFAELRPKVPEFASTGEAEWWMHDARKVTVGQEAGFTINTCTYLDEKPWRDRYEEHEYTGTITEVTEFDMAYWYRYRPLAKGKFRILHFDDDMNPLLTWVEEIVRL